MIPKSGSRFSEKIMLESKTEHDPEKWIPVFGKDHARIKDEQKFDSAAQRKNAGQEARRSFVGIADNHLPEGNSWLQLGCDLGGCNNRCRQRGPNMRPEPSGAIRQVACQPCPGA
jgi:hypothetical protein